MFIKKRLRAGMKSLNFERKYSTGNRQKICFGKKNRSVQIANKLLKIAKNDDCVTLGKLQNDTP